MEFGMVCLDSVCAPVARVSAVVFGLLLFGVLYNALVGWLEKSGHDRGYTAFLVVGGSAVTLIVGILLVGLGNVLWMFVLFAASGLPMVVGSWARSSKARKADEEAALNTAKELLDVQTQNDWLRDASGD